jgi:tetratricopeptide (TPR) repeat protein
MGDRSVHAGEVCQSVVVTGDGNNVALTLGDTGIRLPLRRKQFRPRERRRGPVAGAPPCELDLLVPEAGNLPLIGRKDLFAELQAWLDDKADISVHALIGPAGTGKTRLALEFCGAIDSDPSGKGKWIAGFLWPGDLGAVVDTLATHSFEWERRTLLVVDYAAQCYQALTRWLDRLADEELDTKLRILLLDREAPEAFGWWHELTGSGPPSRRGLFHALRPKRLPDLSDLEERRELLIAALEAAHRMRPGAPAGIPIPAADEDSDFDGRLTEPRFGNPLNLVMAGIIAVYRGPQGALALRHLDAARQIARRELCRLSDLAHSRQIGDGDIRHAMAFNGLAGGIPVADLRKIVGDELAVSRRSTDHLDAVLTLLQQELPPRTEVIQQPRLAMIQPDLIGEAVIIESFTGEPAREAEAAEVVRRAYELDRDAAAHALVRLVQDFGYSLEDPDATDDEKATGHRVMGWLLNLTREIKNPEQAVPLALAIPWQTTILRELVVELTQRLATFFSREAERSNDLIAWRHAAGWFNNLALRLKDLGRREEALAAAEVAVHLRHALAKTLPETAVPDLAQSLNTLANRLSDLGQHEKARTAAEESVRLYRALLEARLDGFTPDLAGSLTNLAGALSGLNRCEEALAASEESVRLYRTLSEVRPVAFTRQLAISVNNLARMLNDLGRLEEALSAAEEAASLFRALADSRPDAFTPDLATSLQNLTATLSIQGRHEQALTAAEEAVRLHRALAEARPDVFRPSLAGSLVNLANVLGNLGQHERALTTSKEAVCLFRSLAEKWPDAFTLNLATSLRNLATTLSIQGRHEQALTAAEEAVRLYRALAKASPDTFVAELARSLWVLGDLYTETGKAELAITTAAEAIQLLTPTLTANPPVTAGNMAMLVQSYLAQCTAVGREPDAELLGPVIAVFESLTQREEKG